MSSLLRVFILLRIVSLKNEGDGIFYLFSFWCIYLGFLLGILCFWILSMIRPKNSITSFLITTLILIFISFISLVYGMWGLWVQVVISRPLSIISGLVRFGEEPQMFAIEFSDGGPTQVPTLGIFKRVFFGIFFRGFILGGSFLRFFLGFLGQVFGFFWGFSSIDKWRLLPFSYIHMYT